MGAHKPYPEVVLSKIKKTACCWEWTSGHDEKGYGVLHYWKGGKERNKAAHRAVWELMKGPIPNGFHIDHLCRNRGCVNPLHLEPVTPSENRNRQTQSLRGIGLGETAGEGCKGRPGKGNGAGCPGEGQQPGNGEGDGTNVVLPS